MINRHATAGLATVLLLQHDATFEILQKPVCVLVSQENIEAIDEYLITRQRPSNFRDARQDFFDLDNSLHNVGRGKRQRHFLQSNDVICRKDADTIFYLKVWFDDFQHRKNYRLGQRLRQARDFLRTYAGLTEQCSTLFGTQYVQPMLCVFANRRHEINIYIPPANILYGEDLFACFLPHLEYAPVESVLAEWGSRPEYATVFGDIYQKIRDGGLGKQTGA